MTKKLLKLLLLLSLVVLLGVITLKGEEKEEVREVKNYTSQEIHIFPISSPVYVKAEVLATKEEKVAYNGNLEGVSDKEHYKSLVEQYDWHHGVAMAVMREESHYNPRAYNPERHNGCNGSFGLMQVACIHIGKYGVEHYTELYDPETNIRVAHEIWKESSWRPWGVCHIQNGVRKVRCWL